MALEDYLLLCFSGAGFLREQNPGLVWGVTGRTRKDISRVENQQVMVN